jgi:hypothetical protein
VDAEASLKERPYKTEPIAQPQCPLYSKLPGDIHSYTFKLALREFEDKSKPYRLNRVYHPPFYQYHTKQDTILLQTCRFIYQEARMMPVTLRPSTYWLYAGPDQHCNKVPWIEPVFDLFTTEQCAAVEEIHLFV